MTKKPLNPLEDQPTVSLSEDDEVETSSGEEEEGSSSDEDDPQPPSAAAVSGTATEQDSDSDSGETETETDSDSEPDEPPKNPNTGSGKAVAVTVAATNPKKKESLASSSATLTLPAVKSGTKRPNEGTSKDEGSAKRAKKDTSGEDAKKPNPFQRLWTEDDEIALLQGLINFQKETGKNPFEESTQFYHSVKKSISFEVSKSQVMDKRRSLKSKYMGKGKNGKQVSFSKPHDLECFALSKTIWGPEGMALESAKSNGKSLSKVKKLESVKQDLFSSGPDGKSVEKGDKKVLVHGGVELEMSDWFESSFLVRSIVGNGVDERTVKQGWRSAPAEAKKKIEEEMKALRAMEIEFLIRKTQFLNDFFSLIAEVEATRRYIDSIGF